MPIPGLDPANLQRLIDQAAEAALPKAVTEATQEVVSMIVDAQIRENVIPQIMQGLVKQKLAPPAILAKADVAKDSGRKLDQKLATDGRAAMPKGITQDPYSMFDQLGFRERPTDLGMFTMRSMARGCPPVAAAVLTRLDQMAALCIPQKDEFSLGFDLDLADEEMEWTDQLKKRKKELTQWIVKCGNPDFKARRAKFPEFIKALVRDSFEMDQACAEIIPSRRGTPAWWRNLDGATMRRPDDVDELSDDPDDIVGVQVYDDTVVAEFNDSELLWGIRNPRTDIRFSGYGYSEMEMLIVIVTALLNAVDFNASFFLQGTVAKGILNFKGAIPDREMEAFRRQWHAMITGIMNAWITPVTNSDEVQWIPMNNTPRDLEFAQFMDWLLKIVCAILRIAPEEIGFQFGNQGQTGALNEGSQEKKLEWSRDKGLVPLATSVGDWISDKIVTPLDERFVFRFKGINARTRESAIELHTKEVKSGVRTVNEVRKERGDEPVPWGDAPADPVLFQAFQLQQGQQGSGGPPGLDATGIDQDPQEQQQQQQQPGAPPPQDNSGPDLQDEAGTAEEQMANSETGFGFHRAQARAMKLVKGFQQGRRVVDVEVDL
jgi:hypothetical protein